MTGAGEMDRGITIQRSNPVPNEFNEPVDQWVPQPPIWAKRTDVSDGERFAAGQVGASLSARFIVRSSTFTRTITPLDRIDYDGAIWNIVGVKEADQGRRRFIEITAAKRAE